MQDEITDVTLESIASVFVGDYAAPEFMKDVKRLLPVVAGGVFSAIPVRLPWPLNQLPGLGFGRSMDARESLKSIVLKVVEERRDDLASSQSGGRDGKSAGLLDSLMELRQNKADIEGVQDGSFDDDFIVDNVRTDHLGHVFRAELSCSRLPPFFCPPCAAALGVTYAHTQLLAEPPTTWRNTPAFPRPPK